MSVPGPLPPGGSGHGPFGLRAFRVALASCVVSVFGGLAMLLLAGGGVAAAGTALLVLGLLGLTCVGLLTAAERLVTRRHRPPP